MHNRRELNLACFHDTVLAPAQYPQTASIPAIIFYAIDEFSYFYRAGTRNFKGGEMCAGEVTITQSVTKPKKNHILREKPRESRGSRNI